MINLAQNIKLMMLLFKGTMCIQLNGNKIYYKLFLILKMFYHIYIIYKQIIQFSISNKEKHMHINVLMENKDVWHYMISHKINLLLK